MTDKEKYTAFIGGLGLRHFASSEIVDYADSVRGGIKNSLPPEDLWPNIVPTIWLLDFLRHEFARPIRLTSIYRSQDYNRAVGGAPESYHMLNMAIDFQCFGVGHTACFRRLNYWRDASVFKGGLGLYFNFVHVDTRGVNATF